MATRKPRGGKRRKGAASGKRGAALLESLGTPPGPDKVGVTVPELIAIVEHLRAFPERLEVARSRAAALAHNPLIFSDSEKPRARISLRAVGRGRKLRGVRRTSDPVS